MFTLRWTGNDNVWNCCKSYSIQLYGLLVIGVVEKLMVVLTKTEKRILCIEFAKHIPKIRNILHLNQREFGAMTGISVDRISRIENEHAVMTWSQLMSMLMVCMANLATKEYVYANNILPTKLFQYFQQKDDSIPPHLNIRVCDDVVNKYLNANKE